MNWQAYKNQYKWDDKNKVENEMGDIKKNINV